MSELVVLLDDDGRPCGERDKRQVHTSDTPLHLAFSCHVFDDQGRVLLTRRAIVKQTWPGVWTNSVCGHPAPRESMPDAIGRRAEQELGLRLVDIEPMLPDFRYRAVDASGLVENEVCPVYGASAVGPVRPDPSEVMDWHWADPQSVWRAVRATPFAFSPWLVRQVTESAIYAD
jgi:isopentenyl-diphosphate delta-isomerase